MKDMTSDDARRTVSALFPEFAASQFEPLGEGMESVAFLADGEFVFRFPKSEESHDALRRELTVVPRLVRFVGLIIPSFRFSPPDDSFVGYRMIRGEMLTRELFESFDAEVRENIYDEIAGFLGGLRHFDARTVPGHASMMRDMRKEYVESLETLREFAFPFLDGEIVEFAERAFEEYLGDDANFAYKPVVVHGDLSSDHILVDPVSGEIAGIIDFGDVSISDADYDMMYLLDDYGEQFVQGVLLTLRHYDHERLFRKLYFWCLADALQMIAHYREHGKVSEAEALGPFVADWIATMKTRFGTGI